MPPSTFPAPASCSPSAESSVFAEGLREHLSTPEPAGAVLLFRLPQGSPAVEEMEGATTLPKISQFYYTAPPSRGSLPLPPEDIWHIDLTGDPQRMHIGTYDYVAVNYHFWTYMVTDPVSPGTSEPALATIGGSWDEPFDLPADPELVMERTGFACLDESSYPPNNVFEESVYYFFDQTCQVETPATSLCHVTAFPAQSCTDALTQNVGMIQPNMHFERVAYNPELASDFRRGETTNFNGPDLAADEDSLRRENRVYYRYFAPGSCDVFYGTIAQPGWRRLVTFSTNTRNDGSQPMYIGDLTNPNNPWRTN